MEGKALIMDGKVMIPQEEIEKSISFKSDKRMFNLLNFDGSISQSNYIEDEIKKFFDEIKSSGKRIVKFTGVISVIDQSELEDR